MTEGANEGLWDFAVRLYGAPGVGDACLALQDRHGVDVPLLLFAAWAGATRGVRVDPATLARAHALVAPWHGEVVTALRTVRRRMKEGPPPAPDRTTEALRAKLKEVELGAERIELAVLEAIAAAWERENAGRPSAELAGDNVDTTVAHFARAGDDGEAAAIRRALETL